MSYFLEQPLLFNQPIRLNEEQMSAPLRVMEGFFQDYHLYECRHHLWEMVGCCIATDNGAFGEPEERGDLLQFYKELEELLEAAWVMAQQGCQ